MPSGLDQNRLNDFLSVVVGYSANASSPFTAVLATPFSASSLQLGHIRLTDASGTQPNSTTTGTEITGGSYVQGTGIQYSTGSGGNFTAPQFGTGPGGAGQSSTGNNVLLQQTGMPAVTVSACEVWDSKGTAPTYAASNRWLWGTLSSSVAFHGGDTLDFNIGAIIAALYGTAQT